MHPEAKNLTFIQFAYKQLPTPVRGDLLNTLRNTFGYITNSAVLRRIDTRRYSLLEESHIENFLAKRGFLETLQKAYNEPQLAPAA